MHVLWGGKAGFRANSDEGIRGEILIIITILSFLL